MKDLQTIVLLTDWWNSQSQVFFELPFSYSLHWNLELTIPWSRAALDAPAYLGPFTTSTIVPVCTDGSVSVKLVVWEYAHILTDTVLTCVLRYVSLHMRTPRNTSISVFFSCWCDIAFFTNWTFMPILPQASSLASFFLQNLLTLCLFVVFWYFSQYFKLSHYYYFLCWSVNFNVITVCWMFWWLATFSNQVFENWGMCIVF